MDEVVHMKRGEFEIPVWMPNYNEHFNYMPEHYWEVHKFEYQHFSGIYSPKYRDFRQVKMPELAKHLVAIRIEYYYDRAYGIVHPLKWRTATGEEKEANKFGIVYEDDFRYFRMGCEHYYTEETIGNCYHRCTCQKCGYTYEYDSSG